MKIEELKEQRNNCIQRARDIVDQADKEGRQMSAEERQNSDKWLEDAESFKDQIEHLRKLERMEASLDEIDDTARSNRPAPIQPDREEEERHSVSFEYRGEKHEFDRESPVYGTSQDAYRKAFWGYLRDGVKNDELRNLQMDSDTAGGYLIPAAFQMSLIEAVDDLVWIRGLANVQLVPNANSLGRPSRENDIADADWTTELATGSEDSTLDFGKRELTPHPLAKRIKVSKKLLRASTMGMEGYVRGRLAYKRSITQEKAFMTGSGAGQPLGVFTASADGIPTSRDVSTDNSATAMTADGLKEAFYNQKVQYRNRAVWVFHRDGCKQIAKLKDGEGNYLLTTSNNQPGGGPDMLFGRPIYESEYAPNTFTTGQYVGIFGDFSHYMIVDALMGEIQRLDELYAATNEVGFIDRSETDGMPVLSEAFTRVTLA